MTDVVTDVDAGNRRRLPTWMLQVNVAADKLRKSANEDRKCSVSDEEIKSQAAEPKIKPVVKHHRKMPTEEAETKQKSESFGGCDTRQRTKKATRREVGPCTALTTGSEAKKKSKRKTVEDETTTDESTITRKKHAKSKRPKNSKVEGVSSERSYEEITLTVEDLMIIAQEYVSTEKEKQCQQQTTRECTSERNSSSLSVSSKSIIGGASEAFGEVSQILSKCTSSSGSSHLTENKGKEGENQKIKNFAANIIDTGDAAQDMLNLYLGPFLKKTPCEEQNVQVIGLKGLALVQTSESKELPSVRTIESTGFPSVWTSESKELPLVRTIESTGFPSVWISESKGLPSVQTIESKGLPAVRTIQSKGLPSIQGIESKGLPSVYELNKQLGSCALSKEEAPLMKKKSSLKDKVAMFFD